MFKKKIFKFLVFLFFCLSILACNKKIDYKIVSLTKSEIDYFNNYLSFENKDINLFFSSYYARIEDLNLFSFIRNVEPDKKLTEDDLEEYLAIIKEYKPYNNINFGPSENLVGINKISKKKVDEILKKYANITSDLLDKKDVAYLEKYNSYYNRSTTKGHNIFRCVFGEKQNNIIKLTSKQEILILEKVDDQYYIKAFLPLEN